VNNPQHAQAIEETRQCAAQHCDHKLSYGKKKVEERKEKECLVVRLKKKKGKTYKSKNNVK